MNSGFCNKKLYSAEHARKRKSQFYKIFHALRTKDRKEKRSLLICKKVTCFLCHCETNHYTHTHIK